jgi:hypothetical protein
LQQPCLKVRWHSGLAGEHCLKPQAGGVPPNGLTEAEALGVGRLDGVGQCDRYRLRPGRGQLGDRLGRERGRSLDLHQHPDALGLVLAEGRPLRLILLCPLSLGEAQLRRAEPRLAADWRGSEVHCGRPRRQVALAVRIARPPLRLNRLRLTEPTRLLAWARRHVQAGSAVLAGPVLARPVLAGPAGRGRKLGRSGLDLS